MYLGAVAVIIDVITTIMTCLSNSFESFPTKQYRLPVSLFYTDAAAVRLTPSAWAGDAFAHSHTSRTKVIV